MFTGIIKKVGIIIYWDKDLRTFGVKSSFKNLVLGESIACSGICLTVCKIDNDIFFCNLSSETLSKTNLKKKKIGDKLNLERSLKIGDDLSGHLVFGHVDGISTLKEIKNDGDSWVLQFSIPKNLLKFLTEKCSVTIDGISLTVNKVFRDCFNVSIVVYTWKNTNLMSANKGDWFNIEIDMLARYVFRALKR